MNLLNKLVISINFMVLALVNIDSAKNHAKNYVGTYYEWLKSQNNEWVRVW